MRFHGDAEEVSSNDIFKVSKSFRHMKHTYVSDLQFSKYVQSQDIKVKILRLAEDLDLILFLVCKSQFNLKIPFLKDFSNILLRVPLLRQVLNLASTRGPSVCDCGGPERRSFNQDLRSICESGSDPERPGLLMKRRPETGSNKTWSENAITGVLIIHQTLAISPEQSVAESGNPMEE